MKNRVIKFSIIFFILIFVFTASAYASYIPNVDPGLPPEASNAKTMAANIIGSLMWIGYAVAVGMLVFIGIKYVMASADEKASMKGMLVKVVIGSLIIAGATTIVNSVLGLSKV